MPRKRQKTDGGTYSGVKEHGVFNPKLSALFEDMKGNDITEENTVWVDIGPNTVISKKTDIIEFVVPRNQSCMWDLNRSYLEVEAQIIKSTGEVINLEDQVSVINNLGQTMWANMELTLGQYSFPSTPRLYGLRAYFENVLLRSIQAKESYMKAEMYYEDERKYYLSIDSYYK